MCKYSYSQGALMFSDSFSVQSRKGLGVEMQIWGSQVLPSSSISQPHQPSWSRSWLKAKSMAWLQTAAIFASNKGTHIHPTLNSEVLPYNQYPL